MNVNKLKEKYHEKFRKNIDHKRPYMEQLLERAWEEYKNHPAWNATYNRIDGKVTLQDREELKALNELIKLYQTRVELKQVKYSDC